jgi:phosphoribosylglycinamide formyltransferase-1
MYKVSVLISGSGSTLDNLAFHCYNEDEGMVRGFIDIKRVVADRDCKGLEIAEKWNLPTAVIKKKDYPNKASWSEALFDCDVNLHVMGGFLSQVVVPEKWKNKILNIHPSLLPAYGGKGMYGIHVHEAVIKNNEKFSGCTVHVVDDELDHGEIVEQIVQGVLPWDDVKSLQHAVTNMEKRLYPRAILNFLRGKRLDKLKISS